MRLLICAGGTGGGVYPAIAVLQAMTNQALFGEETSNGKVQRTSLIQKPKLNNLLWIGSAGGMEEELVKRSGIQYMSIPAAGVHGVGLRALPGNLLQLWRGFTASRKILDAFQPDVLFFTGGYVAVPMGLAGRDIPSVVYVPDIEPGLALKFLSRFADRIAVTAEDSRKYFNQTQKLEISGYPVRKELEIWNVETAREVLNLDANLPTLLVFGGSKGARSINRALVSILPELLTRIQIIHISGNLDWEESAQKKEEMGHQQGLSEKYASRYHLYPYLHEEMGAALTAADLVVSRAGASTLGEFPKFGLPAILVPYPYAWRYQRINAEYLEMHGAAVVIEDEALGEKLLPMVDEILRDQDLKQRMQVAMRSLAKPEAAKSILKILQGLAKG